MVNTRRGYSLNSILHELHLFTQMINAFVYSLLRYYEVIGWTHVEILSVLFSKLRHFLRFSLNILIKLNRGF
jgi:hypothetical protein